MYRRAFSIILAIIALTLALAVAPTSQARSVFRPGAGDCRYHRDLSELRGSPKAFQSFDCRYRNHFIPHTLSS